MSRQRSEAGLTLLLVEPSKQRCGIGTELIRRVEKTLSFLDVRKLTLGRGGDYFWPGLPEEQRQAWSFFRKQGFSDEESSEDLIQALDQFETPSWVSARLASSGSVVRLAKPAQQAAIAAFEKMYFPAWVPYFENEMAHDCYGKILLALGPGGEILGSLLMEHEASPIWSATAKRRVGTLNTLGIAKEMQGRGIGLAMAAGAFQHLRKRGCSDCLIQWTGLSEWYGKLGAMQWAHYTMGHKILKPTNRAS